MEGNDTGGNNDFCGPSEFWNITLLLDSGWPHLTPCFQDTVLIWLPCAWLWLSLPFYLCFLNRHSWSHQRVPLNILSVLKLFFSLCLVVVVIVDLTQGLSREDNPHEGPVVFVVKCCVRITTFLLAAILTQVERMSGLVTSAVQFLFWILLTLCNIVPFYTKIILQTHQVDLFDFIVFQITYAFIIVQTLLFCWAEPSPEPKANDDGKRVCPEMESSILNRLYFWWMNKIVVTAYRKTITEDDIWALNTDDRSETLVPRFQTNWQKEVSKHQQVMADEQEKKSKAHIFMSKAVYSEKTPLLASKLAPPLVSSQKFKGENPPEWEGKKHEPSLIKALLRTYGAIYSVSLLWKFISDVLQFVSPVLLGVLITYADNRGTQPLWTSYVAAIALFVAALVQSVFYHQNYHIGMTIGMRIRCSLIAAIYKKALTLSSQAKKAFTLGEVVNLMSVDCQRIQDTFTFAWSLMTCPVQLTIGIYLLWGVLGPSCLDGLAVLVLMVPLNSYIVVKQRKLQSKVLFLKGKRIKLMNEILNGMKVLKMYTWEPSFQQQVNDIRDQELVFLRKIAYLQGGSTFCWILAPFLVTLATFVTYVLVSEDHFLDARKAFVSLSLFNILRLPINLMSQTISLMVQAWVSVKRIQFFLSGKDLDPDNVKHSIASDYAIEMEHGTFTWDPDSSTSSLKDINLRVPESQLVAVVGQVGCGKSSLISALLGEMDKTDGRVNVKGSVAYVPQEAWIQNATLMDNVLFGKPYLQKKYKKVIDACALTPDLDILPGRDLTEIGEKGINISGGQKQRVSLARAVYSNSDIYLMDDPLSAVDSHVGKHIFEKVIGPKGLLKNKTRVLVTHGVHWLPMVDVVVVMVNGRISEMGTYNQLITHDGPFAQFLKQYFMAEEESEAEEDPDIMRIKEKMMEQVESVTSEGITSDTDGQTRLGIRFVHSSIIKWSVFGDYARSMGTLITIFVLVVFSAYHATSVFANYWLTYWTEDEFLSNTSNSPSTDEYQSLSNYYLTVYGVLGIVQAILVLVYSIVLSVRMVVASGKLHSNMLHRILRAPMAFFDTTPTGRLTNRFSSDIDILDNTLPLTCRITLNSMYLAISTLIVITIGTPIFVAVIVPVAILYYFIMKFYVPTARQLKRIESVTRSPVFNHFSETITGASVIRAYGVTERFLGESMRRVDQNLVYYYANFSSSRWLGVRLEFLGNCLVLAAALFSIFSDLNGASVGLSITYALQATAILNLLVVNLSDLANNIVCVERIKEYAEVNKEADWHSTKRPPSDWPHEGNIKFLEYKTRYREGLDLVLRGINVEIKHNEKIGIVGRTGAGKSSMTLSLFRLIEAAGGGIIIDGVRISDIGLHDLRSKITILPQDPVIFSGTLRMNLDPFDIYSDDQLWSALETAHLKDFVLTLPTQLDYQCGEGGSNLSVGQRQLVCLARTILRKTKILILDEATAAVDYQTDDLIQQTIHNEFQDCTVLSIAHRLNTILDYDRVMVLKDGLIAEIDTPANLLDNKNSIFYGMAKDAGLTGSRNGGPSPYLEQGHSLGYVPGISSRPDSAKSIGSDSSDPSLYARSKSITPISMESVSSDRRKSDRSQPPTPTPTSQPVTPTSLRDAPDLTPGATPSFSRTEAPSEKSPGITKTGSSESSDSGTPVDPARADSASKDTERQSGSEVDTSSSSKTSKDSSPYVST
ncbi:hypothetical protein FSP39_013539 [Pinctada imbricata]|uniref:ABC-type glutathione-S-conjugate transporter n=1 Tax=Pinctada imbricata TaxID=66713 RepID=A0AA88XH47_PINIB|nr:hypothetical protein FSP39_013539 [Pinctada imbricata]